MTRAEQLIEEVILGEAKKKKSSMKLPGSVKDQFSKYAAPILKKHKAKATGQADFQTLFHLTGAGAKDKKATMALLKDIKAFAKQKGFMPDIEDIFLQDEEAPDFYSVEVNFDV